MTNNSTDGQKDNRPAKLGRFWTVVFWGVLIVSAYHLVRDILQIMHLDSAFTDIAHRQHSWCGQYCDTVTLPFDIAGIVIALIVLKQRRVGWLGAALIIAVPIFIFFTLLP